MHRVWSILRLLAVMGWLTALLLISPRHAFACSCAVQEGLTERQEMANALEDASAVFAGEVINIQTNSTSRWFPVRVTLKVSEEWKGDAQSQLSVQTGIDLGKLEATAAWIKGQTG